MEAATQARIDHPGFVDIYETGVSEDGRAYIVMELIEGETLADRVARGPLPETELLPLAQRLAGALGALHRIGLVHRDVHPSNVLVPADGSGVKLIDLGLAIDHRDSQEGGVGTFLYAAPEQTGIVQLPVDGRADLYGLGALLYECLTGQAPFAARDLGELLRQHAVEPAPDVRTLAPAASGALADILARLLAKDPEDRYRSADALAVDLTALEAGRKDTSLGFTTLLSDLDMLPLVGRTDVIDGLRGRLRAAHEGQGGATVLVADVGLGKTRLLRELHVYAERSGALVLHVGPGAQHVPLGVVRRLTGQLAARMHRSGSGARERLVQRIREAAGEHAPFLVQLVPALRAAFPGALPDAVEASQEVYYDALSGLLMKLGHEGSPCVLLLDTSPDSLDDGSAQVLRRISYGAPNCHCMLVCTSRQPVRVQLPLTTVELSCLDDAGVARLAADQLGCRQLPAQLGAELSARTRGNPWSVVEHLRVMLPAGVLTPHEGSWRLDVEALSQLALPDDVHVLQQRCLQQLDAGTRELLAHGAVYGLPFSDAELAAVTQCPEAEVRRATGRASDAGVLRMDPDGRFSFPLRGSVDMLAAQLSAPQTLQTRRKVAQALWSRLPGEPDLVFACAEHMHASADNDSAQRAYDVNVEAGRRALSERAPIEALRHLGHAGELCDRFALTRGLALYAPLVQAHEAAGHVEACLDAIPKAAALEPDPIRRADYFLTAVELRLQANFDVTGAVAELQRAHAALGLKGGEEQTTNAAQGARGPRAMGRVRRPWPRHRQALPVAPQPHPVPADGDNAKPRDSSSCSPGVSLPGSTPAAPASRCKNPTARLGRRRSRARHSAARRSTSGSCSSTWLRAAVF